jgi:endogenous inhibitor of DNA gyrase (YacG/DUF329 family)
MTCPTCKKEVEPGSPYVPFCSDRCRLIDLGNWASEKYRIPGRPESPPEDEEREER